MSGETFAIRPELSRPLADWHLLGVGASPPAPRCGPRATPDLAVYCIFGDELVPIEAQPPSPTSDGTITVEFRSALPAGGSPTALDDHIEAAIGAGLQVAVPVERIAVARARP